MSLRVESPDKLVTIINDADGESETKENGMEAP